MTMNDYINELSKPKLIAFAKEYYGVKLPSGKSKPDTVVVFHERIEGVEPKKELPWANEEVVEEITPIEEQSYIEEAPEFEVGEGVVEHVEELEKEKFDLEGFTPSFRLDLTVGANKFQNVHFTVHQAYEKIVAGEAVLTDFPYDIHNDIKTIEYYRVTNGKVIIRETRNSRFFEYTK